MLAMNWPLFGVAFFAVGAAGVFVLGRVRRSPANNPANWLETEATIQSVGKMVEGSGRYSCQVDVGDFTYIVNDEYYSGRATISSSFSTGDSQLRDLVNKKFQVRYDPRKPEKYNVSQSDVGGFLLDQYDGSGTDIGSIDLNLDKI